MMPEKNITRFIEAQDNVYPQVVSQLQNGNKTTHWMWFIFPQVAGLGFSSTSKFYSIKSIEEAKEYAFHPVLGKRLLECCGLLLEVEGKSADDIFGSPDNLKLQSSMTLFTLVSPEQKVFEDVLKKYFKGRKDERTLDILKSMQNH